MSVRLPLFPLGTVLVPGLVLPLHIFEDRYRVLIQALMELPDGATRQFGVVATRSATPVGQDRPVTYDVGCTAELRDVTPYSDGRFDIVSVGQSRFRIVGLDEDADTPYPTALVNFLPDDDSSDEAELEQLKRNVSHQFVDYRNLLGSDQGELPDDPSVVSYLVAAAMVLDLPVRQRLLELDSTAQRLKAESTLLRSERTLLRAFRSLPAVDLGTTTPGHN